MKIIADQNIPYVEKCFGTIGQVHLCSGREITHEIVKDADVLLVRSITKVDQQLLDGSGIKFVATATIGTEHVDQLYLKKAGIGFASAPGSNADSVAEYVVSALLALGKKFKIHLAGKSIGIVGVGNVGSRVDRRSRALGLQTVLNDPPLARQTGDPKYRSLAELYDCDFITLHTPLTFAGQDKSFHLADEVFFAKLKKGAFFMNTSRGGVTDTTALKKAIHEGRLAGTVLDVWENEPDIDEELLLQVDLSTPHIAGYSLDGKINGLMMVYQAVCEKFDIEPILKKADFLPDPQVSQISLMDVNLNADDEPIIHDTAQQVYTINRDDFNMREMLIVPKTERPAFFDRLRKEYPVRREFANTTVIVPPDYTDLSDKLAGIGFSVETIGA